MRAIALAVAIAIGCAAPPAHAADELVYEPWPHAAITSGIGLLFVGGLVLRPELAPASCRYCGGNSFDRSITEAIAWENHELATTLSDGGLVLLPASAVALGFVRDGAEEGAIDALVFLETLAVNLLATEALKFAIARERPMVIYLGKEDPKVAEHPDDWYVSFPSGHASTSFASVAALAAIADLRGHDAVPIWLVGLPVAAGISYLRVAGMHHWTTDVLAGATLGTLVGATVPRLLHGSGLGGRNDDARENGIRIRSVGLFHLGGTF
jgi:membrane-associated phospholipid phosphatase